MRSRARFAVLAAMAVVGTSALAIVTNLATGSSINQWDQAGSLAASAVAATGLVLATVSTFLATRAESAEEKAVDVREQLAMRLIRTFAAIEREALAFIQKNDGESLRQISLREVRMIMADATVWDSQDQIGFDLATRARNAIVHGDLDGVDSIDLRYANDKASQLLEKVREAGTARRRTE